MKHSIEIEASDALLDVGVSLPLFEFKIPFRRKPVQVRLTMRRPCLGSQIRIAKLYLETGVTFEEMELFSRHEEAEFMARHGRRVSRMIALAICRGAVSGLLFSGIVAWLLRWFADDRYLMGAVEHFTSLLGTKHFTTIIKSVQLSNPLKPRKSQKRTGS